MLDCLRLLAFHAASSVAVMLAVMDARLMVGICSGGRPSDA
jgi:hypothetical protein